MVSEIWQMVDLERAGALDEDGLMVCTYFFSKTKPKTWRPR
jgi:hypothetical protein